MDTLHPKHNTGHNRQNSKNNMDTKISLPARCTAYTVYSMAERFQPVSSFHRFTCSYSLMLLRPWGLCPQIPRKLFEKSLTKNFDGRPWGFAPHPWAGSNSTFYFGLILVG